MVKSKISRSTKNSATQLASKLKVESKAKVIDESTRVKLLSAATLLFSRKGFDRVSVRDIAKESGYNISLVSYYFGGKERLYIEIFKNYFNRIHKEVLRLEEAHKDIKKPMTRKEFLDEFRKSLNFMMEEFLIDPELKILMHRELMDGFPRTKKVFEEHFNIMKGRITHFYERAQYSGHIKASLNVPTLTIILYRSFEAYLVSYFFVKPIRELGIDPVKNKNLFLDQFEEIFLKGALS